MSPILFAIYLNDFEYFISRNYKDLDSLSVECSNNLSDEDVEVYFRLYVLLYADDTIVLAESKEELQDALTAVHNYCTQWKLTVNTSKAKVIIFSKGKAKKLFFEFGNDKIESTDSYVYLGVLFNFNCKF